LHLCVDFIVPVAVGGICAICVYIYMHMCCRRTAVRVLADDTGSLQAMKASLPAHGAELRAFACFSEEKLNGYLV